jgi:hypothetical protein
MFTESHFVAPPASYYILLPRDFYAEAMLLEFEME